MNQGKITDFFTKKRKKDDEEDKKEEEVVEEKAPQEVEKEVSPDTKDQKIDEEETEEEEEEKLKPKKVVKKQKNTKSSTTTTKSEDDKKDKEDEKEEKVKDDDKEEEEKEEKKPIKKKPVSLVLPKKAPAKKKIVEDEEKEKEKEEKVKEKVVVKSSTSTTSTTTTWDDLTDQLLDESWKLKLKDEFEKSYFKSLIKQLNQCSKENKKPIYPPKNEVFTALNWTPLDQVRVVIIGQDPYHGAGQAHGLSFSVKKGITAPPSLKNMYKELETDIEGFKTPKHGFLEHWARQGVLMLNAVLTVDEKTPNSHKDFGWASFTDAVLRDINKLDRSVVFILWGEFAKKKASMVDKKRHHIIASAHPSPMSVTKFYGSKPFSKTNTYLKSINSPEIDWNLPQSI